MADVIFLVRASKIGCHAERLLHTKLTCTMTMTTGCLRWDCWVSDTLILSYTFCVWSACRQVRSALHAAAIGGTHTGLGLDGLALVLPRLLPPKSQDGLSKAYIFKGRNRHKVILWFHLWCAQMQL